MEKSIYGAEQFQFRGESFLDWVSRKLNLEKEGWKLVVILLCLTWLPIVIITGFEGTLISGTGLPFLKDITFQSRVLIGIPMMILIKNIIYKRIPNVLQYFSEVLMRPEDREVFINGAFRKAKNRGDSTVTNLILLVIVIAIAMSPVRGANLLVNYGGGGSWFFTNTEGNQVLSNAARWASFISIPVFQFLLLKWLYRYVTWTVLVYRISRMKLRLQPTHPDATGGLGILLLAQRNFVLFFVVCGMVISGNMIDHLLSMKVGFDTIRIEILGFLILCLILVFFPMFFFTGMLIRAKHFGEFNLSNAGASLSRKFENNWVTPLQKEERVSEDPVDPSMLYDYSGIYILLQQLHIVPVKFRDIIIMALILFVPFIPLFVIQFSIAELIQKLLGLLI